MGGRANGFPAMATVQPTSLAELPIGVRAHVVAVQRCDAVGDRMAELGLTPGAAIQVLRAAPWGGPLLLKVRDYVLSLRRAEAASVAVAPQNAG